MTRKLRIHVTILISRTWAIQKRLSMTFNLVPESSRFQQPY